MLKLRRNDMRLNILIYEDDISWCCKINDEYTLQESTSGFGDTPEEALKDFAHAYFYAWEECV